MKGFKKLALASAIIAAPAMSHALEALDDVALSEVTGQDGIIINADLDATIGELRYRDNSGITGGTGTFTNAGDLVISDLTIVGDSTIEVDVGADGGSGSNAALFVNLQSTSLSLNVGSISVVAAGDAVTPANEVVSLDLGTINITNQNVNVALGSEAVNNDNLAEITANIGNITSTGPDNFLSLSDQNSGGALFIADADIQNIAIGTTTVNIDNGALSIVAGTTTVGSITLNDIGLGAAGGAAQTNTIGDVIISNLTLNPSTITITGRP